MTDTPTFQRRGSESTRIEAFVDAAFAFALTLVVISVDAIPSTYSELVIALKDVPAFLACFAMITTFWIAHRNWSDRFGLDTTFSTLISLALVFVIMIYVYPLKTMMIAAFSMITNGWLPGSFELTSAAEVRGLFSIYGVGFTLASLLIVILNYHAYQLRESLDLSVAEQHHTITEYRSWLILSFMGVVSVLLAWLLPPRFLSAAGWVYSLLAFIMPAYAIYRGRKLRQTIN